MEQHSAETAGKLEKIMQVSETWITTTEPQSCPLCSMTFSSKPYAKHVGRHLRELSLFALPTDPNDERAEGDNSGDDSEHKCLEIVQVNPQGDEKSDCSEDLESDEGEQASEVDSSLASDGVGEDLDEDYETEEERRRDQRHARSSSEPYDDPDVYRRRFARRPRPHSESGYGDNSRRAGECAGLDDDIVLYSRLSERKLWEDEAVARIRCGIDYGEAPVLHAEGTQEPGFVEIRRAEPAAEGSDSKAPHPRFSPAPPELIDSSDLKPPPQAAMKSILRKPTEMFPEDPNPIREGVAPLKDAKLGNSIPAGARWTKISRDIVDPQALEEGKERFEERFDCVIVLRVLTRDEVQKYVERTWQIRGKSAELSRSTFLPRKQKNLSEQIKRALHHQSNRAGSILSAADRAEIRHRCYSATRQAHINLDCGWMLSAV